MQHILEKTGSFRPEAKLFSYGQRSLTAVYEEAVDNNISKSSSIDRDITPQCTRSHGQRPFLLDFMLVDGKARQAHTRLF